MRKIAVFPGSFDPITTGHFDLVQRAIPLFDEIVVAIGVNSQKKYLFSLEQRQEWLRQVFAPFPTVQVDTFDGLTAHFCNKIGSWQDKLQFLLRFRVIFGQLALCIKVRLQECMRVDKIYGQNWVGVGAGGIKCSQNSWHCSVAPQFCDHWVVVPQLPQGAHFWSADTD